MIDPTLIRSIKTPPSQTPSPIPVQLDWREYFMEFCAGHGGDPVEHRGRLLFRDGWTYSRTDYAGPEWPPPDNHYRAAQLRLAYWQIRQQLVHQQIVTLNEMLQGLRNAQQGRRVPLQIREPEFDDNGNYQKTTVKPLDFTSLEERLEWLLNDYEECDSHILEQQNLLEQKDERRTSGKDS